MATGRFENGVNFYTTGIVNLKIHFPENELSCNWCPFCRAEDALKRYWCRLTNEMIYNPYSGIADGCPISFNKEE